MMHGDPIVEVKLGLFFMAGMLLHYFRDMWDSPRATISSLSG